MKPRHGASLPVAGGSAEASLGHRRLWTCLGRRYAPRRVPNIKSPVSKDVVLQLLAIGIGIQAILIDRMNVVAVFAFEKAGF